MVLCSWVGLDHGSDYRDGESFVFDSNCLQLNFFWAFLQFGWSQPGEPRALAVLVRDLPGESVQNRNKQ